MTTKTEITAVSLAGALATALVILATPHSAKATGENLPDKDKRYGVALKGQNDGIVTFAKNSRFWSRFSSATSALTH
jgi:uncharacterized membrane protein